MLVHDLNSTANIPGLMYNITDGTRYSLNRIEERYRKGYTCWYMISTPPPTSLASCTTSLMAQGIRKTELKKGTGKVILAGT